MKLYENFSLTNNKYKWQKINLLVERAAPYKNFTIYPGLTNWCSCGEIDLFERDFIGHLKDHHHGVVLRNSQLNRPPWLDLVKYKNDLIEEIICYSEEELETNLLDNILDLNYFYIDIKINQFYYLIK